MTVASVSSLTFCAQNETWCSRCPWLDSGVGNSRTVFSTIAFIMQEHFSHMRPSEELRAHCMWSHNGCEDLILVPDGNQGTSGWEMEVYVASEHLYWPTTKPPMLENIACSTTFTHPFLPCAKDLVLLLGQGPPTDSCPTLGTVLRDTANLLAMAQIGADFFWLKNSVGSRYCLMLSSAVTLTRVKFITAAKKSTKMRKKCMWSSAPLVFLGWCHCCPFSQPVVNFITSKAADTV